VDVEIEREPMMKREKDNACIVKGERKSFFFLEREIKRLKIQTMLGKREK